MGDTGWNRDWGTGQGNVVPCITLELISIVLEQVEDNDQTRKVVCLATAEGPEVRFCCLSFQKRFLKVFSKKNSQGFPSFGARWSQVGGGASQPIPLSSGSFRNFVPSVF